ncbi:portal protein [Helicobacter sp. MIT 11-5569]|uniref:portal protein n=1 Tax=Helicobacter sp. MIT 11-5569 TaxID=1548151 RepID=UPI000A467DD7|nr:portal protein [Helicobacter sp. MIT 11-5569]
MLNLEELEAHFQSDLSASSNALSEFKEAVEYYHSDQLPEDVRAIIAERNQVPLHENMFKMIVNKILGYKAQAMQEVRVSGRQEQDRNLANLLNDLLKTFSQQSAYNKEILKRDFNLILGIGIIELWTQKTEEDIHITLKSIAPNAFVIDKYSCDKNALDSRRFHKTINLSEEEAKELVGKKASAAFNVLYDGEFEKRVNLIESWIKEDGIWNRYFWLPKYGIYRFEKQPFKNNTHPFIIAKYLIDHKGAFYGLFRDIKPLQDYINFAENRMVNMLGSFKVFYESGAVLDKEDFVSSASLDNSFTEINDGGLEKLKFVDAKGDIAVISQKVNEKRQVVKMLTGVTDEVIGVGGTRQSGSAIAQRRDAGLMSLQDFIKTSDDMDKLIFGKVIDFMQHYFTRAQVFRIVDKEVGERYFSINTNPKNTIRVGFFDLDFKTTLKEIGREERFTHWSEILKVIQTTQPQLVQGLLPLVLKDIDSPIVADVESLFAKMEEAQQQAQEQESAQNAQYQQIAQELQMQKAQAEITERTAKASKYAAQAKMAEAVVANGTQASAMPKMDLR